MHNFVYLAQRRSQEFSCEPNFVGGVPRPPLAAPVVSSESSVRYVPCYWRAGPTTFLAPQFATTAPLTYQATPAGAVPGPMQLAPTQAANGAVVPAAAAAVSLPQPPIYAAAAPPPRQTSVLAPPTFGAAAAAGPYQPVIYWYPSPPVSPQTAPGYYVQSLPTTVLMKGLPSNMQIHDVLSFLDGLVEVNAPLFPFSTF